MKWGSGLMMRICSSKNGAVGGMFKADGAIGGTAEKMGGLLSRDGAIG